MTRPFAFRSLSMRQAEERLVAGVPCPRCGGQILRLVRAAAPSCLQCGYEPSEAMERVLAEHLAKQAIADQAAGGAQKIVDAGTALERTLREDHA